MDLVYGHYFNHKIVKSKTNDDKWGIPNVPHPTTYKNH
jgi:hypothetical protein